jgi:hypothetical protein
MAFIGMFNPEALDNSLVGGSVDYPHGCTGLKLG